MKTKALALNDASLQDAVLAREVDANRQLYKSVLERMKEIGVAGEVPTSNVSIIDTATAPIDPSSPKKLIDMAIAGAMALFLGVGIAFLLDHLDDGLHNPEEAELYLQLPSLGSVPDFLTLGGEDQAAETALPANAAGSQSYCEQRLRRAGNHDGEEPLFDRRRVVPRDPNCDLAVARGRSS